MNWKIASLVGLIHLPAVLLGSELQPFLETDAGANWVEDIPVRTIAGLGVEGTRILVEPGVRLGLSGGVFATPYLALSLDSGLRFNSFDSVEAHGISADVNGNLWQVPLLASIRLQYPNPTRWTPFAQLGGGGSFSIASLEQFSAAEGRYRSRDFSVDPAYQVAAGVRYTFSDRFSGGLAYKYFVSDTPEWNFDGTRVKTGDIANHSLLLGLSYRF